MNVSIIIPNFNGEKILKDNIPFVFRAVEQYSKKAKSHIEIILVDDKSTDNSRKAISELIAKYSSPQVSGLSISNERNLGFSPTVNKGVKHASGEIIVILNSDVRPKEDFLLPLLSHFANESVFAVGCLEKSVENGKEILRGRGIGRWEKGFLFHERGEVDRDNTLWASGGSSAYRKSIWDKLGGFIELYKPYYWEDNDLSYRALKAGYKIFFEPQSMVTHEHEYGSIRSTQKEDIVRQIAYRNQFFFVWINATDVKIIVSHILWLPYHFINAIRRKDVAFIKGMTRAILKLPQIMSVRGNVQKMVKVSDKNIVAVYKDEIQK